MKALTHKVITAYINMSTSIGYGPPNVRVAATPATAATTITATTTATTTTTTRTDQSMKLFLDKRK